MRSTHARWAMFSPFILTDQVTDMIHYIYLWWILASSILLSWLKNLLIDISLSISGKLYSDAVRSGSSDRGNGIFDWLHVAYMFINMSRRRLLCRRLCN